MFRLYLRVEPFAALFWALSIVQYCTCAYTVAGDPARRPGLPQLRYNTAAEG